MKKFAKLILTVYLLILLNISKENEKLIFYMVVFKWILRMKISSPICSCVSLRLKYAC